MDELKQKNAIQIYEYGDTNIITHQITTKVIILNGEDLSQLLQSLIDRINALETKPLQAEVTEPPMDETVIDNNIEVSVKD